MAPSKQTRPTLPTPNPDESSRPQRQRTLFQRISSSLASVVPSISRGRKESKSKPGDRPSTAPAHSQQITYNSIRKHLCLPEDQSPPIPDIQFPRRLNPDDDCQYNPNTYHSFPSIKEPGCDYCGLKSFSRSSSGILGATDPCNHCETRSPFSHLSVRFNCSSRQSRSVSTVQQSIVQIIESTSSSEPSPRAVPTDAASRMSNPPRRSSLPGAIVPSPNLLHLPSPPQAGPSGHVRTPRHPSTKGPFPPFPRPISPKLHHFHGLPKAKAYPYVHKHEVSAHLTALRAGSPSPLRHSINEVTRAPISQETIDYSRTVFYPAPSSARRPSGVTITQRSSTVVIEESRPTNLDAELQRTNVYRRRSPQAGTRHPSLHDDESEGTFSTLTTQTPSTVGGTRLELKGGGAMPMPRLRGGGKSQLGWGYKLKEWLLTCRANEDEGVDVASLPVRRVEVKIDEGSVERGRAACGPDEQHMLGLRGGAGSPERLPPTLYWLAGGRGRPITVSSWRKQRGKRKMGGLLGMAVFGGEAGKKYASCDGSSKTSTRPSSLSSSIRRGEAEGEGQREHGEEHREGGEEARAETAGNEGVA